MQRKMRQKYRAIVDEWKSNLSNDERKLLSEDDEDRLLGTRAACLQRLLDKKKVKLAKDLGKQKEKGRGSEGRPPKRKRSQAALS